MSLFGGRPEGKEGEGKQGQPVIWPTGDLVLIPQSEGGTKRRWFWWEGGGEQGIERERKDERET